MEYTVLIILLALVQYVIFTLRTGSGRVKYGIDAPRTSGDEAWERLFRVQQNTLEQLAIFIPGAFIFGWYITGPWVLIPGLLFLVGRQLYSMEYTKDPRTRVPGMAITFLANAILLGGGLIAVLLRIF
ncbi:MAG: MAPEG family protein [Gammaproteobacteria bacterium]|nr:MAPEG family protein [Gammaproteobacteria bacterium]